MSGFTTTPNYALKKPIPNADDDQWGTHLNQNADVLDATLLTIDTKASAVPPPSSSTPAMDLGAGAAGSTTAYSRGDHAHPVDTSRYAASNPSGYQTAAQVTTALAPYAPIASPTFTGTVTLPGNAASALQAVPLQQLTSSIAGVPTYTLPAASTTVRGGLRVDGTSVVMTGDVLSTAGRVPPWLYSDLPAEVQQLPMAFFVPGKPAASAVYNLAMAFAVTVPASLAGAVVFYSTLPTATTSSPVSFAVNKISAGTTTAVGTVSIGLSGTSNTYCVLSGAGGSLAIGDVLQLVAPGTQDATLANLCVTILAARV